MLLNYHLLKPPLLCFIFVWNLWTTPLGVEPRVLCQELSVTRLACLCPRAASLLSLAHKKSNNASSCSHATWAAYSYKEHIFQAKLQILKQNFYRTLIMLQVSLNACYQLWLSKLDAVRDGAKYSKKDITAHLSDGGEFCTGALCFFAVKTLCRSRHSTASEHLEACMCSIDLLGIKRGHT